MRTTTSTLVAVLLLAGCGGAPAEGDRVACETVIGADNALMTSARGDDPDSDLVISLMRVMPTRIAEAQEVVESPELQVELRRLHALADYDHRTSSEDAGVAFQLQIGVVERACQDAGVDVTRDA